MLKIVAGACRNARFRCVAVGLCAAILASCPEFSDKRADCLMGAMCRAGSLCARDGLCYVETLSLAPCSSRLDCGGGFVCSIAGRCLEVAPCHRHRDCPVPFACVRGACASVARCDRDEHCLGGGPCGSDGACHWQPADDP